MSLISLMTYIALVAVGLTTLNYFIFKNVKNIGVTYVQNFAGALFVFTTLKALGLIFFRTSLSLSIGKSNKGSGSLRQSHKYPHEA